MRGNLSWDRSHTRHCSCCVIIWLSSVGELSEGLTSYRRTQGALYISIKSMNKNFPASQMRKEKARVGTTLAQSLAAESEVKTEALISPVLPLAQDRLKTGEDKSYRPDLQV